MNTVLKADKLGTRLMLVYAFKSSRNIIIFVKTVQIKQNTSPGLVIMKEL